MPVHGFEIFQNNFGTAEMRTVWGEDNMVQKWLECEKAIALEMAELGLIPQEIAFEIEAFSKVELVSPALIARFMRETKHLGVSLVKAFNDQCTKSGEQYHLGLTTDDVLLTGLTLQIKEAHGLIHGQLLELEDVLMRQAERYKHTIMIGRTHGQHALPTTLGFLLAGWAGEIRDHIDRLEGLRERLFRAKYTAAVGTRASWVYLFGKTATRQLVKGAAARLGLLDPVIDIQTRSDRLAEIGFVLANITTSLGKIGLTIRHYNAEEIREVQEPWDEASQHSSSTMPNKQNPEGCEWLDGLAKVAQGNASALMNVAVLNERDATRMAPFLKCIADNFLLTAAALQKATHILGHLRVNEDQMRHNLYMTGGLVMAEAVMLALWRKTNEKVTAHSCLRDLAVRVQSGGEDFRTALLQDAYISSHLTADEIDALLDPEDYIGDALEQLESVLAQIRERRAEVKST